MQTFFEKYGWTLHLLLIVLAAVLLAWAVNGNVARLLAPYTVPEVPDFQKTASKSKTKTKRGARRPGVTWTRTILGKCLFGCSEEDPNECKGGCEDGELCQAGVCVPTAGELPPDLGHPVKSELPVKLLGSMVAQNADYSLALLVDSGSKQTHIARVGDVIKESAEIVEILRDRVILRNGGRLEFIRLENSISGNPAQHRTLAAVRRPSKAIPKLPKPVTAKSDLELNAKGPKENAKPIADGVDQTGPDSYRIDRGVLDRELGDPKKLARQGSIIPNFKDGKKQGVKLVGLTPGSVYSKIGIRSGDVVHGINGKKIVSQNQLLEMLKTMREANNIELEVERRGKKKTIRYEVE
jgi:general secretion pathway protein C